MCGIIPQRAELFFVFPSTVIARTSCFQGDRIETEFLHAVRTSLDTSMGARCTRPSCRRRPRAELPTEKFALAIRKDRRLGSAILRALGSAQVRSPPRSWSTMRSSNRLYSGFSGARARAQRSPLSDAKTTAGVPDQLGSENVRPARARVVMVSAAVWQPTRQPRRTRDGGAHKHGQYSTAAPPMGDCSTKKMPGFLHKGGSRRCLCAAQIHRPISPPAAAPDRPPLRLVATLSACGDCS
jgi:hypothetical protein